jgi:hypothetical protein
MFYYLLYNSSFSFIVDNRLFSTILYGSILYILTHAILNYCSIEILTIINHYFWIIFVLDIISLVYGLYLVYTNPSQSSIQNTNDSTTSNNLSVSFNLLKNKINTLLDRKNDLTITHINTPFQNTSQSPPAPTTHIQSPIHTQQYNNQDQSNIDNSKRMSTPISQLNKQKQQKQNPQHQQNQQHQQNNIDINIPDLDISSTSSTPINLIRTRIGSTNPDGSSSGFPEPIINEDVYSESVAGSDVGSVMDLDDFEKSL